MFNANLQNILLHCYAEWRKKLTINIFSQSNKQQHLNFRYANASKEKSNDNTRRLSPQNNVTIAKQLADKYGVTYQAVSKWENGKNIPDISLIKQMSKDFNIDIEDILEGKVNKKKNKKI